MTGDGRGANRESPGRPQSLPGRGRRSGQPLNARGGAHESNCPHFPENCPDPDDRSPARGDVPGAAEHTDPNLVNGWGVAFNPFGFVWVADGGTGVSTPYDGNGNPQSLVVTIPGGKPTGIVFN